MAQSPELVLLAQLHSNNYNQQVHSGTDNVKFGKNAVSICLSNAGLKPEDPNKSVGVKLMAVAALFIDNAALSKINISPGPVPVNKLTDYLKTDDKFKPLLNLLTPDSNGKATYTANVVLVSWQDASRALDSCWGSAIIDLLVKRNGSEFGIFIRPYSSDYLVCSLKAGSDKLSWMDVKSGHKLEQVGYVSENSNLHNFGMGKKIDFEKIGFQNHSTNESKNESKEEASAVKSAHLLFVPKITVHRARYNTSIDCLFERPVYRSCSVDIDCRVKASRIEIVNGSIAKSCKRAETHGKVYKNSIVYSITQAVIFEGECAELPIPQLANILLSVFAEMVNQCDPGIFHIGSISHGTKVNAATVTKTSSGIDICDLPYEDFVLLVGKSDILTKDIYNQIMSLVKVKVDKEPLIITPDQRQKYVLDFFKLALDNYKPI